MTIPVPTRTPPRTPLEASLADIWAAILNRTDIAVEDDFFAIGGHSMRAVQMISRVRDAFLIELPMRTVFEQPTLGGLAAALEALSADAFDPELEALLADLPPSDTSDAQP